MCLRAYKCACAGSDEKSIAAPLGFVNVKRATYMYRTKPSKRGKKGDGREVKNTECATGSPVRVDKNTKKRGPSKIERARESNRAVHTPGGAFKKKTQQQKERGEKPTLSGKWNGKEKKRESN